LHPYMDPASVVSFILDPPRCSVRMVETTILAHHEAIIRKRGWVIPSLEIEPPIVQGQETW
jgi:hypothetical protein